MGEPTVDGAIEAVLFDIDSTLIKTGGAGAAAWARAFEELHGRSVDTHEVTEPGMTDPEVSRTALRVLLGRKPGKREISAAISRYLVHLDEAVAEADRYHVLPGIEELLERLSQAGILLGLTTGNVEAAAHIKLSRAGLNHYFCFGGYGSDAEDRVELTRQAIERALVVAGGTLEPRECISVGDSPRDIAAGHGAGIRVVGVGTGDYSPQQLREIGADWALETVENGFPV
jgi:phosphoglycolate phosphatase